MASSKADNWAELGPIYETHYRQLLDEDKKKRRAPNTGVARKHEGMQRALSRFRTGLILDAGSGPGVYTRYLLSSSASSVVSMDISRVALAHNRDQTPPNLRARAGYLAGNIEKLPFADASFDGIVCSQVIEHLLDDEKGMREFLRVLRPGGTLLISTDNAANVVSKTLDLPASLARRIRGRSADWEFPHRDYSRAEFVAKLERAGFVIEDVDTFRFTLGAPLNRFPRAVRGLDAIERGLIRLPGFRRWGDILNVTARRPPAV